MLTDGTRWLNIHVIRCLLSLLSGENQCCTEQFGTADLSNENGEITDGQSDTIPGKICKFKKRAKSTLLPHTNLCNFCRSNSSGTW